ncbi:hypothetical protein MMH89_00060 [Candidatus Comchoanobacter bicostacola]|uniref:Transposase n=1 Tax=Candidatus Comchoanobacter bicostacola TaxID=2919598 RepID=A0ABY5DJW5_9GAMM|nr:hypothetical protein [Candidatus Comchoanobacter bicostacola]UTC24561.1 hypothetical protein MMH89_00060 [Candidatus Comchoanobacter bicostacola]
MRLNLSQATAFIAADSTGYRALESGIIADNNQTYHQAWHNLTAFLYFCTLIQNYKKRVSHSLHKKQV